MPEGMLGKAGGGFTLVIVIYWRRNPESNRATRICNPLHNHSAIAPTLSVTPALIILQKAFLTYWTQTILPTITG